MLYSNKSVCVYTLQVYKKRKHEGNSNVLNAYFEFLYSLMSSSVGRQIMEQRPRVPLSHSSRLTEIRPLAICSPSSSETKL